MEIIINSWVWIRFDWSKVHGGNKDIGLFTEKNMTSKNKNIKKNTAKNMNIKHGKTRRDWQPDQKQKENTRLELKFFYPK